MGVANSGVTDGRIAILSDCVANLTVYLLESSDSRCVDRHLRYPENLRSLPFQALIQEVKACGTTLSTTPPSCP